MGKWVEVKITLNRSAIEGAYAVLESWDIQSYAVEDTALMDEAQRLGWGDYFPEINPSEQVTISCYFAEEFGSAKIGQLTAELQNLAKYGFEPGDVLVVHNHVEEQDWAHAWKEYYEPQRIGRVLIWPSWLELSDEESGKWDLVVQLDPGMAFGSGTHPSTAMCVEFLQELNLQAKEVWDVGTGSGILAIIAAKFGAKVKAVDVDPVAVKVSQENMELNEVDFAIHQGSLEDLTGEPQVIVANIVAKVIGPMLPQAYRVLQPGGYFIASGVIEERDKEILSLAEKAGFRLLRKSQKGEWVSYLFQRGE